MADSSTLPGLRSWPQMPPEWWRFFRDLSTETAAPTVDLSGDLPITTGAAGSMSVRAIGTLASGFVNFQLVGDSAAPGNTRYYGTDATGAKGFHALPTPVAGTATVTLSAAAFQHSQTVAAVGVTPESVVLVSLAPVADDDANDPELLDVVALWATPGTDQITFGLTFSTKTVGPIKLNWSAI